VLLLAGACYTANLTLYNWWAAGGPPVAEPQRFKSRGNLFCGTTCLFLAGAAGLAWIDWRLAKKRRRQRASDSAMEPTRRLF